MLGIKEGQPMIEVNNLTKAFSINTHKWNPFIDKKLMNKTVVDHISFNIPDGQIVGYIGPNGAGKSTTIKMLTGILSPTSGDIRINGFIPHKRKKEYMKQIGVVFGQRTQLWWELPVGDSLNLIRHIYKVSDTDYKKKIDMFHDLLSIGDYMKTPVRQLSLGQRMRADFAASLLHDPKILFLDEPTIGLDISIKKRIRSFIETINRELGVTILLTTHDISDIEALCHRTIIIDHGKIIVDGDLDEIRDKYVKIRTIMVDAEEFIDFTIFPEVKLIKEEGTRKWISFDKDTISPSTIMSNLLSRYKITDFTLQEPQLESFIQKVYEGSSNLQSGNSYEF